MNDPIIIEMSPCKIRGLPKSSALMSMSYLPNLKLKNPLKESFNQSACSSEMGKQMGYGAYWCVSFRLNGFAWNAHLLVATSLTPSSTSYLSTCLKKRFPVQAAIKYSKMEIASEVTYISHLLVKTIYHLAVLANKYLCLFNLF